MKLAARLSAATARASAAALLALAAVPASQAAPFTVYNSLGAFSAAVVSPGVDDFNDMATYTFLSNSLTRSAGAYGYTVSTVSNLYAAPAGNPGISTASAGEPLIFGSFAPAVFAWGANTYTAYSGIPVDGVLSITITDVDGETLTQTFTDPLPSQFVGFVSQRPVLSVSLMTTMGPSNFAAFPYVDNLMLGSRTVPLPPTLLLALAALGGLTLVRRGLPTSGRARAD